MNKNLYSGKLIAVDGPNGAGKTTIIQELKKELEKRRIKACLRNIIEKIFIWKIDSC